ncbi:MAG: succinate dehydrogenase, cytochrome b556 subunit [Pseudomonadota bacterium]
MASIDTDPRPLSPHLSVWRFTPAMLASITHRGTGVALYGGTLFLAIWLIAAAAGPEAFARVQGLYGSPIGLAALFGWTWAVLFHMMNGINHLFRDTGRNFDPAGAQRVAVGQYVVATLLAVAVFAIGFSIKGGAA